MSNPTAEFRGELKSLRDQILASIDTASIGDVEDGLDLYRRLTSATLRTFNELRERTGLQPNSSWFNPYGQEMEWLETDIRSFVDRTFANFNDGGFDSVVRFLLELLNEFWESNELGAHGRFLGIAQRAHWDALLLPTDGASPSGSILTSIRSHGVYRLANSRTQFSDEMVATALTQVVNFFFEAFRLSLKRSPSTADRCAIEIREFQEELGFTHERSGNSPAIEAALGRIRAFALGAAGYVLLLNEESRLDDEAAKAVIDRIASLLPADELWTALVEAEEDFGAAFPWSDWERDVWPAGQRSGFMGRLGASMDEAAAIWFVSRGRSASNERVLKVIEPSQAAWFVQKVIEKLDAARNRYSRLWLDGVDPDVIALTASLTDLKARLDEADQEARHRLALVPEKIDAFLDAAETSWLEPTPLRSAAAVELSTESPPEEIFGHSSLMPKDFFTGSKVYADPSHVGKNFGNALSRGESARIVEMLGEVPHRDVTLAELPDQVSTALQRLRADGYSPEITAVNSWRVAHSLTESYDLSGSKFDGATVAVDYAGESTLCIVADYKKAVRIRRWAMVAQAEEDQLRASGLLLGGIRDVTDEFARELVRGNDDFLRADDGSIMSVEEAERKLHNRVVAKLFCKLAIELVDTGAARVFSVVDDDG